MQTALVSAAILVSVLHKESLNFIPLRNAVPLANLTPVEQSPKPASSQRTVASSSAVRMPQPSHVFTAPTTVPSHILLIDDLGDAPPISGNPSTFSAGPAILGAIGTGGRSIAPPVEPQVTPQKIEVRKPVPMGGRVQEARLIKRIMPVYPPLARSMRLSGVVHLIGVIAKDGTIQKLEVIDGHPLFTRAALDAVQQWVYRPTLLNGEAVEVIAPIEVHFTLSQ